MRDSHATPPDAPAANPTAVVRSDVDAAHRARWDTDTDHAAAQAALDQLDTHHDQVRAHLAATHRLPWHTDTAPTRDAARQAAALHHIAAARDALAHAWWQVHAGGPLRDGADPRHAADYLRLIADRLDATTRWADTVRPPLGAPHPRREAAA